MFEYIDNPMYSKEELNDAKAMFGIDGITISTSYPSKNNEIEYMSDDDAEAIVRGDYYGVSSYIVNDIINVHDEPREEFMKRIKSDPPEKTIEFIFGEFSKNNSDDDDAYKWKKRQCGKLVISNCNPKYIVKDEKYLIKEDQQPYKCYVDDTHYHDMGGFIGSKAIEWMVYALKYNRSRILLPKFINTYKMWRYYFQEQIDYRNEIISQPAYVRFK